jgi:hypothetical protein
LREFPTGLPPKAFFEGLQDAPGEKEHQRYLLRESILEFISFKSSFKPSLVIMPYLLIYNLLYLIISVQNTNSIKAECLINTINPIIDDGAGRHDEQYDKPPL